MRSFVSMAPWRASMLVGAMSLIACHSVNIQRKTTVSYSEVAERSVRGVVNIASTKLIGFCANIFLTQKRYPLIRKVTSLLIWTQRKCGRGATLPFFL